MGLFDSGSKWNHDMKIDKKQHRRDIVGYRSSSRYKHEERRAAEDARVQARKDKKAESNSGGICGLMVLGGSGVLAALIAGAVAGVRALV